MQKIRLDYLLLFITAIAVFIGIPLVPYFWNFRNISNNPNDWASFGDYLGGTANTFLALLNLAVVIWIAKNIYRLETEREESLYKLETEREERLQKIALIPLCEFFISSYDDRLVISIKNLGNGPAKIKKITFNKLTKNGITPTNLAELLPAKLLPKEEDYAEVFCTQLDGESYLEAGGEIKLLTVQKSANNKKANSEEFGQYLEGIRSELSSVEIVIDYADMFDEEISRKGSLRPFKTKRLRG